MTLSIKSLIFIAVAMFCFTQSAEAQRVRLEARMGANDAIQAKAKYEQRGNRMKFNAELEDAQPNQAYGIRILRGGRVVYSSVVRTSAFGVAEIDVDNTEGDSVPRLQRGDAVQVLLNNRQILAGSLR